MGALMQGDERAPVRAGRRLGLPLLVAIAVLALPAPDAGATFHLMMIREIHLGGASGGSYVELQMWTGGQNAVKNHPIAVYDPDGSLAHTFKLPADVTNGQSQATILVAGPGYATAFPSGAAPDATDAGLDLPAAGGAVCFTDAAPPDCVSWGDFDGDVALPSPGAGTPASATGVTAGKALRRSIAEPCATLLEPSDDSDDSATDFAEQTPNPRSNGSPIVEKACVAPTAVIDGGPSGLTKATGAAFTYRSEPAGASFECKLDLAAFAACEPSGTEYAGPLSEGKHTFQVRAKDANGTGAPASRTWTVDTQPPTATILTQPTDPSPGNSAAFTYGAGEAGSSFQCSLVPEGEPDVFSACPSTGKTYPDAQHPAPLADGKWTFAVRATDQIGNQGAAASYTWEVDNQLADETPPQTTLTSVPPDPSSSPSAAFVYESNEAGSTFECSLDSASFAGCPGTGIAYAGLSDGAHSFQVRATDGSGNTDATPAGYSWQVAVPAPPPLSLPSILPPAPALPALPETTITGKPGAVTRDRTPTFRFRSSAAGSSFRCKVDRGAYRPCRSPFTTKALPFGSHTAQIRATAAGLSDPSPAKAGFKVVKRGPPTSRGRG